MLQLSDSIILNAATACVPGYSMSREMHNVWCRMVVAYRLSLRGYGSARIGKILGVDHSTVVHYIGKYKNYMWNDNEFTVFSSKINGAIDDAEREADAMAEAERRRINMSTDDLIDELKYRLGDKIKITINETD